MSLRWVIDDDGESVQTIQRTDTTIVTNESLNMALFSQVELVDDRQPWSDLASWYWDFWGEIENDLARAYSEDRIPSKRFRDQLVRLYFENVHPLCPIFDEVEFFSKYYLSGDELSFLQCISLLEFQAMMFAASLHLNTSQIRNTRYHSTFHCHTSLFDIAKATYNACQDAPPIVLTRAALLLTYWSPYNSETQANSYWVDQAFSNACRARLYETDATLESVTTGRRKLIWWCCLLRDRLLAFGLRRTKRLHEEPSSCEPVCYEDFGLETSFPRFMDMSSKWQSIENFIQQCALSDLLVRILRFQEQVKGLTDRPTPEVTSFHSELLSWRQQYEMSLQTSEPGSNIVAPIMPVQLTRIYCEAAIATLYLPFASVYSTNDSREQDRFSGSALGHVKEASSRIATFTEVLGYRTDSNHLPLALGAWIALPIAVKLVFIGNSANPEDLERDLREMRSLMNVLYILKTRFTGGQYISNMLDAVISHISASGSRNSHQSVPGLLRDAASIIGESLAVGVVPTAKL